MRMNRWIELTLVQVALFTPAASARVPHTAARPAQGARVVINEVQYDPPTTGSESAYEWVEVLNAGDAQATLEGWQIADNRAADELPDIALRPGEFLVIAGGEGFSELYPSFAERVVTLQGSIGNGLGNGGDRVRLLDASGALVDGMSYGNDVTVLDPSAPAVKAGHSLERVPAGVDTDTALDWLEQPAPTPGRAGSGPAPTEPPPPATLPPGAGAVLNEYLPAPRDIDWDGDGEASSQDEWIELYNPGDVELDIRGWQLDDVGDSGSEPYVLPAGSVIAARGHLVIFRRVSNIALNNGGDSVRLLDSGGRVVDVAAYERAGPDKSFSRQPDGSGPWTDALPPSPGRANAASPSPSPSSSATPGEGTPKASAAPSGTPGTPRPSTSRTPAPSATDAPVFLPFLVTEVLFDPVLSGNDAAAEWVELYNLSTRPESLEGWAIGDAVSWDALPPVAVPPRRHVVIAASEGALERLRVTGGGEPHGADPRGADPPMVVIADGRIGNGLSNRGDMVRVRGPTGEVVDAVSYGANLDAFDPAVPIGPPGFSIERLPPDRDTDSAEDWWPQPGPSPGWTGGVHTTPARVTINEVLPAPSDVDWDGNGTADYTDEWVELHNAEDYDAQIGGWRLIDRDGAGWAYTFPVGRTLPAHGFTVVYRGESGIALANDHDGLRLVRSDTVTADQVAWESSPGYDRSLSRTVDGAGVWTSSFAVTPGEPNHAPRLRPEKGARARSNGVERALGSDVGPATATSVRLDQVRSLPAGARVSVAGWVTAPAGIFGDRVAYLGNENAGVRLYLSGGGRMPGVPLGAQVWATGLLADYHGERQLVLEKLSDLRVGGTTSLPQPLEIATGALGEASEGRLVRLGGQVSRARGGRLWLNDGSGEAQVVVRPSTGIARPLVQVRETLSVTGIVAQYAARAPWSGGYRLLPRFSSDIVRALGPQPKHWPHTGRAPAGPQSRRGRTMGSVVGRAARDMHTVGATRGWWHVVWE